MRKQDSFLVQRWWIMEERDPAAPKGYRRVSFAESAQFTSTLDARAKYAAWLRAGAPEGAVDWGVVADFPVEAGRAVPCPAELRSRLGSFKLGKVS